MSSLLTQLVVPLNLGVTLLVLGVLLFILRRRRLAGFSIITGFGWVIFWSLPATSLWAGGHLEQLYPYRPPDAIPVADAMVVLGGSTANHRQNWFEPLNKSGTQSRVETAAELYHAGRARNIVVSGAALEGSVSEAQVMAHVLRQHGVPADAIIQEDRSLTTYENALYSARILKNLGVNSALIVTSALHMPRAMGVFRKQNIEAIPAGSPPQIVVPESSGFTFWLPSMHALSASRSILKEYIGMLVYWLRGWI